MTNEEKMRTEFENFMRPFLEAHTQKHTPAHLLTPENYYGYNRHINIPLEVDIRFLESLWKAALSTRPDVNQELVEANRTKIYLTS